jgi:hypothetical protein
MFKTKRVGGIRFVWIGRLVISYSVTKPKNPKVEAIKALKRRINDAKRNYRMGVAI